MALSVEDPGLEHESCILNPFKKKPVIKSHPILDYTADMSSLLAYYSAKDDAQDDRPIKGRAMAALFSRSARRARRLYPELSKTIADELTRLNAMEPYESPERLAATFGLILEALMRQGIELLNRHDEPFFVYADLLETAANALGQWVYLLDAVDDLEEDKRKKNHNPFLRMEQDEAMTLARTLLIEREETIDRHLSLIDYERFGAIVYNIVTMVTHTKCSVFLTAHRLRWSARPILNSYEDTIPISMKIPARKKWPRPKFAKLTRPTTRLP